MPSDGAAEEQGTAGHPEEKCWRCHGPNVPWYAPSPLWNAVMRREPLPEGWPEERWSELICPTCFAVLTAEAGVAQVFRLDAKDPVGLSMVSPGGRVWDAEADLWVDAP